MKNVESENFWGPSLELPRASVEATHRFVIAVTLIVGTVLWVLFVPLTESHSGQWSATGAFVAFGGFAWSCWHFVKGIQHAAEAKRLKANPPGQIIWYTLSDSGIRIHETSKTPPPPAGIAVPWTAMDSLLLVTGATPSLLLTYHLPGNPKENRAELASTFMRTDGVALSERMRELYDMKITGASKPTKAALSVAAQA